MNSELEEKQRMLREIQDKKGEIELFLKKVEKGIYDFETKYLENTQSIGNVIKGWEQIFTAKSKLQTQSTLNNIKKTKFSNSERVFSESSYNNPMNKDNNLLQGIQSNSLRISSHMNLNLNKASTTNCRRKKLSLKKKSSNPGMNGRNFSNDNNYA
jgi:hypothetical protein